MIEAPVEKVWSEVGDPSRYPEWAGDWVEVADLDEVAKGERFRQTSSTPLGKAESEFVIEELEDLREIQVRCLLSGYYLRWSLTEAGEDTFAEVEVGMDPLGARYHVIDKTIGRRWYRRVVDETLERLRATIG